MDMEEFGFFELPEINIDEYLKDKQISLLKSLSLSESNARIAENGLTCP